MLGDSRDAEVLRERLLAELSAEPDDLVMGPIAALIEVELRADHRKAHDRLVEALQLRPLLPAARSAGRAGRRPAVHPARGRPGRTRWSPSWCAARTGGSSGWSRPELRSHPRERDHWYHEIRKAAKRLRYAGEAVEPAFGAASGGAGGERREPAGGARRTPGQRGRPAGAAGAGCPDPSGRRERLHHRTAARPRADPRRRGGRRVRQQPGGPSPRSNSAAGCAELICGSDQRV